MASKGLPNRMMSNATVTIPASEYKALLRDKAALDFLQAEMDKARASAREKGVVRLMLQPGWGPRDNASSYVRVRVVPAATPPPTCASSTDVRVLMAKAAREAERADDHRS